VNRLGGAPKRRRRRNKQSRIEAGRQARSRPFLSLSKSPGSHTRLTRRHYAGRIATMVCPVSATMAMPYRLISSSNRDSCRVCPELVS
jgi:hypothetical protein